MINIFRISLLIFAYIFPFCVSAEDQKSYHWLLQYAGKSTNELRGDSRIESLINNSIPKQISETLLDTLSGPPNPVFVVENRYISMSACVPHYCPMKGFYWADVETKLTIGAIWGEDYKEPYKLKLTSNSVFQNEIPLEAMKAIKNWLYTHDLRPKQVVFIAEGGKSITLVAENFQPPVKFIPPITGPSFDCLKANGVIEKAICNDGDLAYLDLSLHSLFYEIKNGLSEAGAQKEIVDFQRAWIKERNKKCSAESNVVLCLNKSYREQDKKLKNWLPKST